ncbi:BatD family protein [Vibrio clamense]|uniref:BatD family protein n=1 Tax=Vibrio clamense TaxID=2910254 RepID=UPI003D23CBBA
MKRTYPFFIRVLSTVLFSLVLGLSSIAHAESLVASVSKNRVAKDEVFQLKIVADHKLSSENINFTSLESDFYLGRPSFGSAINIINGDRSVRSEWTVSLAALKLGTLTIPSFSVGGVSTQPIVIQSSIDTSAPSQNDMVEFQTQLEKNELYPNESTRFHARLIIKADPRRLQNPQIIQPKATGVRIEAIGDSKQYQSVIDGMEVTIVDQSYHITADDNGHTNATLLGPSLKGAVVYGGNRNGSTRLIQLNTKADSYTIKVLAKPDNYRGFWLPTPSLTLKQTWQDESGKNLDPASNFDTKVGESLTRTISLTVDGLSETQLPNLNVTYPDSLRVYDEKPQFDITDQGQTVMTVKQVLIPKSTGSVTLPSVKIPWWNTQLKQQETANIDGLTLEVKPGNETALTLPSAPTKAVPVETQTITVIDAGIWPYLTYMFATLWLITVLIAIKFWRTKPKNVGTQASKAEIAPQDLGLLQTIDAGDPIRIQQAVSSWMYSQVNLDTDVRHAMENELQRMHESHYGETRSQWSNKSLLKLIKKAMKISSTAQKSKHKSVLAKL